MSYPCFVWKCNYDTLAHTDPFSFAPYAAVLSSYVVLLLLLCGTGAAQQRQRYKGALNGPLTTLVRPSRKCLTSITPYERTRCAREVNNRRFVDYSSTQCGVFCFCFFFLCAVVFVEIRRRDEGAVEMSKRHENNANQHVERGSENYGLT